jgi:hypothetical protein
MKMYIESDNGGRAVAIEINKKWYFVDCAPYGTWGDIDILDGTEEEAAARIREGIKNGECYGVEDCAAEVESDTLYQHIPEYDGMTVQQVEEYDNRNRTCDFTTYTEI